MSPSEPAGTDAHPGPDPQGSPPTSAEASAGPSPTGHPDELASERDELPEDFVADGLSGEEGVGEGAHDYLSDLRRVQADFENFKKQTARRQAETVERAAEGLVKELLPVLDAGELAVVHGGDEVVALVGTLRDVMTKAGLDVIAPESGAGFDPNEHDAVTHEPGDGEPAIVEVLRSGYRWKGRLLRPAMVRVKG